MCMLYHLSENPNLTKITPRIPRYGVEKFENLTIERVCFSKTIEGCLSALQDITPLSYYVYTPVKHIDELHHHIPTIYDVIDGPSNDEIWILEDVEVECIGKVLSLENDYNKEIYTKKGTCWFHHYKYEFVND